MCIRLFYRDRLRRGAPISPGQTKDESSRWPGIIGSGAAAWKLQSEGALFDSTN